MELLRLNTTTYKVELNKPWLMMVPEFRALIDRDKGSPGDYRGQYKLKATDEISYIYLMEDWKSPYREMSEEDRKKEAFKTLSRLKITEEDLEQDEVFQAALSKYVEIKYRASRALKTLDAILASLEDLDDYFNTVDFSAKDNQGKLLHSMSEYLNNIKKVDEAYEAIEKFMIRVAKNLENAGDIAGKSRELGFKEKQFAFEHKRRKMTERESIVVAKEILELSDEDRDVLKDRARKRGDIDDEPFEPEESDDE